MSVYITRPYGKQVWRQKKLHLFLESNISDSLKRLWLNIRITCESLSYGTCMCWIFTHPLSLIVVCQLCKVNRFCTRKCSTKLNGVFLYSLKTYTILQSKYHAHMFKSVALLLHQLPSFLPLTIFNLPYVFILLLIVSFFIVCVLSLLSLFLPMPSFIITFHLLCDFFILPLVSFFLLWPLQTFLTFSSVNFCCCPFSLPDARLIVLSSFS